ncbi:uncharacterized protein LAESUDRAFT_763482 [Laetiporus sulphureus 93-53]|uniref:Uncharacterized protein n=1 Tax=Laetiporus sulphureus 93-53 TaxID=1314785 RepID=A0A165BVT2_9APHY|nr:uncharacterized protein LAESUDRAFT_763482 [Laetiporus sulphureus 93-53]KZT01743.1 hypothetical protein LAESUDRAFT_763482 [Laetiporus sulphureus 93-53]
MSRTDGIADTPAKLEFLQSHLNRFLDIAEAGKRSEAKRFVDTIVLPAWEEAFGPPRIYKWFANRRRPTKRPRRNQDGAVTAASTRKSSPKFTANFVLRRPRSVPARDLFAKTIKEKLDKIVSAWRKERGLPYTAGLQIRARLLSKAWKQLPQGKRVRFLEEAEAINQQRAREGNEMRREDISSIAPDLYDAISKVVKGWAQLLPGWTINLKMGGVLDGSADGLRVWNFDLPCEGGERYAQYIRRTTGSSEKFDEHFVAFLRHQDRLYRSSDQDSMNNVSQLLARQLWWDKDDIVHYLQLFFEKKWAQAGGSFRVPWEEILRDPEMYLDMAAFPTQFTLKRLNDYSKAELCELYSHLYAAQNGASIAPTFRFKSVLQASSDAEQDERGSSTIPYSARNTTMRLVRPVSTGAGGSSEQPMLVSEPFPREGSNDGDDDEDASFLRDILTNIPDDNSRGIGVSNVLRREEADESTSEDNVINTNLHRVRKAVRITGVPGSGEDVTSDGSDESSEELSSDAGSASRRSRKAVRFTDVPDSEDTESDGSDGSSEDLSSDAGPASRRSRKAVRITGVSDSESSVEHLNRRARSIRPRKATRMIIDSDLEEDITDEEMDIASEDSLIDSSESQHPPRRVSQTLRRGASGCARTLSPGPASSSSLPLMVMDIDIESRNVVSSYRTDSTMNWEANEMGTNMQEYGLISASEEADHSAVTTGSEREESRHWIAKSGNRQTSMREKCRNACQSARPEWAVVAGEVRHPMPVGKWPEWVCAKMQSLIGIVPTDCNALRSLFPIMVKLDGMLPRASIQAESLPVGLQTWVDVAAKHISSKRVVPATFTMEWLTWWHSLQPVSRQICNLDLDSQLSHPTHAEELRWPALEKGGVNGISQVAFTLCLCFPAKEARGNFTLMQWHSWLWDLTWVFQRMLVGMEERQCASSESITVRTSVVEHTDSSVAVNITQDESLHQGIPAESDEMTRRSARLKIKEQKDQRSTRDKIKYAGAKQ